MKSVIYTKRGEAKDVLHIEDRPIPTLGPGEVRVRVQVSAVNPSDTKSRGMWSTNGAAPAMAFPEVIPHQDGSGIIDAVGAGVDPARVGERVWLYMTQWKRPFGTAAEYVVTPAERAVVLPDAASFAEGASLGIPAMTAHYALFSDGPVRGKTVLVTGGAGAVGFYAIQLAKWSGAAQVLTTVSRDQQATQARRAGADVIINRKTEDVVAAIRAATGKDRGVDRIIEVDLGANQHVSRDVLAPRGVIASYASDAVRVPELDYFAFAMLNATLRTVLIYEAPQEARDAAARDIVGLLETGRLKHQTASRMPLERIAEAHEAMESGTVIGKVLIDVAA